MNKLMKKYQSTSIDIAVIGGTGVCDPNFLKDVDSQKVYTPFGSTSSEVLIGKFEDKTIAFIPRHGSTHQLPPQLVPYQANIWALKELGVKKILAPCSVGSLQPHIKTGDLLIPDQFFDWTKNREYSFFNGGQGAHISMADPLCSTLRKLAIECAKELNIRHHEKATTVTIEGPRFSTRAESMFFKNILKGDIIGMTLVPECVLAREVEICYVSLAMVTDYDAWKIDEEPVSHASVEKIAAKNTAVLKQLLRLMVKRISTESSYDDCSHALDHAMV
jgi:5'-methylthioadenosine phosphorylase